MVRFCWLRLLSLKHLASLFLVQLETKLPSTNPPVRVRVRVSVRVMVRVSVRVTVRVKIMFRIKGWSYAYC